MKKQLIKEIDKNGQVWYWTELNGEKVTPYGHNEEEAIEEFKKYVPITPSKQVIMEEDLGD